VTTTTAGPGETISSRDDGHPAHQPLSASARAHLRQMRGMSYEASLILSLSVLVVSTGIVVSLIAFRGARTGTAQLANDLFREVSDHAVTKTRGFLQRAVPIAQAMGELANLGLATDDRDKLARQLAVVLKANPGVTWISYGNEAGEFVGAYRTRTGEMRVNQSRVERDGKTSLIEHDVLDDGSWKFFRRESDTGFDPRVRPYYLRAKEAKRIVWPPPYVFYDQGVAGVTCANPLYDSAGKLQGVLTVDFDLDTLSRFVEEQESLSAGSKLFIMTSDGTVLADPAHHPAPQSLAEQQKPQPLRRGKGRLLKLAELNDPLLVAFEQQLTPGDRTTLGNGADRARQFEFRHGGVDYYARATAFTISGDLVWIVGAVAPQTDFLGAARRASAWSAAASIGATVVAVCVAMILARRVSGPVRSLVTFMDNVRGGDLNSSIELGGAREFRQLSAALDRMLHDLRDRLRLRGAMAVASQVQQGLLPACPPSVPGLDVHGYSAYCDETGGDYFDYLVLDRNSGTRAEDGGGTWVSRGEGLLVAIGDVVGHGIGSALVMAGARGVLHSRATGCGHLGELMTHLNEQLVPDLGGSRFITMMLWYVDPRRGTACWANAGHDPAIVYDPVADQFTESGFGEIPLGIEPGVTYAEHSFGPVRPGQVIVLATDGVWETVNPAGEMFGRERLKRVIRENANGCAADIVGAVERAITSFRAGGNQRDDVTLVVIKVKEIQHARR
jgi:sigma-B regulation protein RsbU (phosphoserine phosphatase)